MTNQVFENAGVTLQDGTFLTRKEILEATPLAILTCTTAHLDLSYELGKSVLKNSDSERLRLFTNMIAQKSAQARLYTSIFFLLNNQKLMRCVYPNWGKIRLISSRKRSDFILKINSYIIQRSRS